MSDVDSRRVDAVELAIASDLCERQRSLVERASETEGLFTLLGVQSIEPEGVGAASVAAEILGDDGFTVTIELEKGAHVAGSEGERVFLHHRAGDFGGVETHIVSVDEINERCGR